MRPSAWQSVLLFTPVVYFMWGVRWRFFEVADVSVGLSLVMILVFLLACLIMVWWMFKSGYRLKS